MQTIVMDKFIKIIIFFFYNNVAMILGEANASWNDQICWDMLYVYLGSCEEKWNQINAIPVKGSNISTNVG